MDGGIRKDVPVSESGQRDKQLTRNSKPGDENEKARMKNAIKVQTANGFQICQGPHEFSRAVGGEFCTKAERAALVKLWSKMLAMTLTPVQWPPAPETTLVENVDTL